MPNEKRQFERFKERATVLYKFGKGAHREDKAFTIDLSTQGARIITDKNLPIGSVLELRIEVPDSAERIYVKGEVVWTKEMRVEGKKNFEVGIRFLKIALKDRSRLYFKGVYRVIKR